MALSMKAGMSGSALQSRGVTTRSNQALLRPTILPGTALRRTAGVMPAMPKTVAKARSGSGEDVDFDKVLSDIADKFEKSENKAAIIGYSFAAVGALWFSEWLIHLPGLNFILGFPIQLLGLVLIPYFSVKYFVDNDSLTGDAGSAFDRVVKKLPGFEK